MKSNYGRIRFQLLINGEPKIISGIESHGVMVATVSWAGNAHKEITREIQTHPGFNKKEWLADDIRMHLGGLDSETEEHITWLTQDLQPGDEVTIRVLPAGECDLPIKRHVRQPDAEPPAA